MRTGVACTTQLVFFLNGALPLQQHGVLVGGRTYAILNYVNSINSRIITGLLLVLLFLYAVLQFFTRQFCSSCNFASCFVWV
jgi:hypothetical protein